MQAGFASRPHERSTRRLILHIAALDRLTSDASIDARSALEHRLGRRMAHEALARALGGDTTAVEHRCR